jgi:hypothetical protein
MNGTNIKWLIALLLMGLSSNAYAISQGGNDSTIFLLFYFGMFPALWFLAYRNKPAGYGPGVWYFAVSAIASVLLWLASSFIMLNVGQINQLAPWISSTISLCFYWYMLKWPITKNKIETANSLASMSGVVLFIALIIIVVFFGDSSSELYPRF